MKKLPWLTPVRMIALFAAAALLVWFYLTVSEPIVALYAMSGEDWVGIAETVCVLAGAFTSLLLSRLGALIGSVAQGHRVLEFSILGWGWRRTPDGPLRFQRCRGGLMNTLFLPSATDGSARFTLMMLGPTCMLLTASALMGLLALLLWWSMWWIFPLILALMHLLYALVMIFPRADRRDPLTSIWLLHRHRDLNLAHVQNMLTGVANRLNCGLQVFPEGSFLPISEAYWHLDVGYACVGNQATLLLNQRRFDEALDLLTRLEKYQAAALNVYFIMVNRTNGALAEILTGQPGHFASLAAERETAAMMNGPLRVRYLLLQYADALLIRRDEAAAAPILSALQQQQQLSPNGSMPPLLAAIDDKYAQMKEDPHD